DTPDSSSAPTRPPTPRTRRRAPTHAQESSQPPWSSLTSPPSSNPLVPSTASRDSHAISVVRSMRSRTRSGSERLSLLGSSGTLLKSTPMVSRVGRRVMLCLLWLVSLLDGRLLPST
ncbi:hypothetical protein BGX24_000778, partial [Mortierella sp. AD032]